ncbi:MAG: transposase [Thermomicrobiales bacterium]|nr:transposase [Thermomicrobiales bacterium]
MPDLPRRRNSLRYPDYDYAQPGGVFVTFCTHNRQHLFGSIQNDEMFLSAAGLILARRWMQIPDRFNGVMLDDFAIMPDHMHGILWIGTQGHGDNPSSSEVVRWVKVSVQRDYSDAVKRGAQPYEEKMWQRSYYDRIIRNDRELESIRGYIQGNPYFDGKKKAE